LKSVPVEMADRLRAMAPEFLSGPGGVTFPRVTEATGIPRATLYYYFSGKDDLLSFLAEDVMLRFLEAATAAAEGKGTVSERLERALVAAMSIGDDHPSINFSFLRVLSETGSLVPRLLDLQKVGYGPIRQLLLEGCQTGELTIADVDLLLISLFGALLLLAITELPKQGRVPPESTRAVIRVFLDGIRTRPAPRKRTPQAPASRRPPSR
jgi:TetR/AcrR family transcriptional regulator